MVIYAGTQGAIMIDIAAIKARADKATAGGWIVIETTHPYKFTPSRPEFKGEGFHVERRIATAWDHPQLKDKYPLVNIATGIGTPESGAVHMCSIEADDADFIAHARTDIPALIAALEASEAARVKAEQERDALKAENHRLSAGLIILSTSFYKGDQHQAYAKHILEAKP